MNIKSIVKIFTIVAIIALIFMQLYKVEATSSFQQFTGENGETSSLEVPDKYKDYVAIWQYYTTTNITTPEMELIINKIENGKVSFDLLMYHVNAFENASATLLDNTASFDIKSKDNVNVKGTITLSDNKVTLNIKESTSTDIKVGTTEFTRKADKSVLKGTELTIKPAAQTTTTTTPTAQPTTAEPKKEENKLPQTGTSENILIALMVVLAGIGIYAFKKTRDYNF